MTTCENEKWMVAMCTNSTLSKSTNQSRLVQLPDPCNAQDRQYVLVPEERHILEIQSLSADFSSFFVGRHIVKDGSLYILNPVDPLFFVLAAQEAVPNSQTRTSWQPFDQTIGSLPAEAKMVLEEKQFPHLYQTLCNDQTDNKTYYKFSAEKSLSWLGKKQQSVYQCLLRQQSERKKRQETKKTSTSQGGSASATFNMPEDPMAATPSNSTNCTTDQLRNDSVQIVCNYLSEEWTNRFLDSLQLTRNNVFDKQHTPSKQDESKAAGQGIVTNIPESAPAPTTVKKVAQAAPARSMGNKRLEKVNKRGMSSMTSFFGVAKKSKTKQ